ncbi:unnamed protein product [Closterium sp. Naga37s-1]|nr:unnamed protein product [Closterium sp. Naga37s-1]
MGLGLGVMGLGGVRDGAGKASATGQPDRAARWGKRLGNATGQAIGRSDGEGDGPALRGRRRGSAAGLSDGAWDGAVRRGRGWGNAIGLGMGQCDGAGDGAARRGERGGDGLPDLPEKEASDKGNLAPGSASGGVNGPFEDLLDLQHNTDQGAGSGVDKAEDVEGVVDATAKASKDAAGVDEAEEVDAGGDVHEDADAQSAMAPDDEDDS